jgi:hypothetical protein
VYRFCKQAQTEPDVLLASPADFFTATRRNAPEAGSQAPAAPANNLYELPPYQPPLPEYKDVAGRLGPEDADTAPGAAGSTSSSHPNVHAHAQGEADLPPPFASLAPAAYPPPSPR